MRGTVKQESSPKIAKKILSRILPYEEREALFGDFDELFLEIFKKHGYIRAWMWYWIQILILLPRSLLDSIRWRFIMLRNYFKIAVRIIKRSKVYSFINISGLAVGMACCILILLWVKDELSFDRFHENADMIYRVTDRYYSSSGGLFSSAITAWPLAEALKNDFPEIVESARLRILTHRLISYQDKKFYENDFVAVDPSFLKMFSFPLVAGDITTALTEPNTILITEETAARYFGTENPMGKVLTYNNHTDFKVTGVLKNVPHSSHIRFDFLVPFESTLRALGWSVEWWTDNYTTYVQLAENASIQHISDKVSKTDTPTADRYPFAL
jgi:hypothetical protein